MRRRLSLPAALLVMLAPLLAQETPQAETPAAEVPPAVSEQKLRGEVEVGYRWVQDVGGSRDVYRSIVNLGDGPKLFNGTASFRNPEARWIDRLEIQANSWGGEPYNTGRIEAGLAGMYAFRLDYRNVAYFNSLPSFANPLLAEGVFLSERAMDIQRRLIDTELEIKPGARISPYLAFYRGSGFGRGVTTFVVDGNEFPVSTDLRDGTNSYRGGVHLNLSRFGLTLEQGGTAFKDDQQVFFTAGGNRGNRRTPLFGRTLALDNLRQAYGARGDGVFNRAVVQGRPWSRLQFNGQFLYSQPAVDVRYTEQNRGEFFLLSALAPYTTQLETSGGEAKRPHISGSWSTEVRPFQRLRIVQSWFTDRFHVSSFSVFSQTFNTTPVTNTELRASDLLLVNYSQHQIEAMVDVGSFLTLRGGHRYVWGDAVVRAPALSRTPGQKAGELRRHIALAGGSVRLFGKVDLNLDLEASPGDRAYFRTDLMNYQRARARVRYKIRPSLAVSAGFAVLNNRNSATDVGLDLRSQQSSLTLFWSPNQGKRFTITADYSRSTLRSDLPFLEPQTFETLISRYRDNGHHGGAYLDVQAPRGARLSLGGSYSINTGSRPTRYYQPQARFLLPLAGKIAWTSDWRWFGFTERRYAFENFHTHAFSTGLRLGL